MRKSPRMVVEKCSSILEIYIKENGWKVGFMVLEPINGRQVICIKDNIYTEKNMDKELFTTPLENFLKALGEMVNEKDLERF